MSGRQFLQASLSHRASEMRSAEERCRQAYRVRGGYMFAAAQRLADTYAKAAQVFESELAELEKETQ
jgi:hypothetical protein